MKNYLKLSLLSSMLILLMSSCVSFEPGWQNLTEKTSTNNPNKLLEKAQNMELNSSTSEEITLLIDAYMEVVKVDPNNYKALWKIGNYHMLMGAAHSTKTKSKKYHYKEAIKYCELAMYTNADFKSEIVAGKEIPDACEKLTINEVDAMGYWYTARFYYFKECFNPIGRTFNTSIVMDNNKVISHNDKLDPNWAGGGNYFSRALFYIATPAKFGGSKERATQEFASAIEIGPNYFVNRWGRAKYLYSLTGDIKGFKADMKWVTEQDPHNGGNTYAWNIYFQNDAKKELEKLSSK